MPPTTSAPSATDLERVGQLRTAFGRINRGLRRTRARGALSPSQWEVLATVARRGTMPFAELADAEGLHPTMLSRIAAKLEADGLVSRSQDREDARMAHLAVTAAGRRRYAAARAERTDALLVALDRLGDRDRRTLLAAAPALERLGEQLRDGS